MIKLKAEFESDRLDQTDLKILGRLRKNARETLTGISKAIGVPISSTYDRLKRLEGLNVIERYSCLFDVRKIGIHVRTLFLVRVDEGQKSELEAYLRKNPFVNNLAGTNGEMSFVAECLFRDMKDLESFTENIRKRFKGIKYSVHHLLQDLKRESFFVGEATS